MEFVGIQNVIAHQDSLDKIVLLNLIALITAQIMDIVKMVVFAIAIKDLVEIIVQLKLYDEYIYFFFISSIYYIKFYILIKSIEKEP